MGSVYGRTLAVMLGLVAVVAAMGFYNWRVVPQGPHGAQVGPSVDDPVANSPRHRHRATREKAFTTRGSADSGTLIAQEPDTLRTDTRRTGAGATRRGRRRLRPAVGYDAASLILLAIRTGARTPAEVRSALEQIEGFEGGLHPGWAVAGRRARPAGDPPPTHASRRPGGLAHAYCYAHPLRR